MKLDIITVCKENRKDNLLAQFNSITKGIDYFDIDWIILYANNKDFFASQLVEYAQNLLVDETTYFGTPGEEINFALNLVSRENSWIYILNENNIIHRNFFPIMEEAANNLYNSDMFILGQRHKGGLRFPSPLDFDIVNQTNRSQIVTWKNMLNTESDFKDDKFIKRLYSKFESRITFVPIECSYLNRLEWKGE